MKAKKEAIKPVTLTLVNEKVRSHTISLIENLSLDRVMVVTIKEFKPNRKLAQNKLQHKHYKQIADQMFENPIETKCRCKLDYAVPILLSENEAFAETWLELYNDFPRELQLAYLVDKKVTSLLTVKQASDYIKIYMQIHEESGLKLSHPDDMWREAMGIRN